MKVTGLHSAYCHSVFGQYKLWDQSEPTTFNSVQVPYQRFVKSDGDKSLNLRVDFDFNHTQVIYVLLLLFYNLNNTACCFRHWLVKIAQ